MCFFIPFLHEAARKSKIAYVAFIIFLLNRTGQFSKANTEMTYKTRQIITRV